MGELREIIRLTEAELADIEKNIVHLKHEYEAAQKELAQCRHEISVIDVEVRINSLLISPSFVCLDQWSTFMPCDGRRGRNDG